MGSGCIDSYTWGPVEYTAVRINRAALTRSEKMWVAEDGHATEAGRRKVLLGAGSPGALGGRG